MTEKGQEILVGIDLGTSQSSICTSTGERQVVDSYVGWPVDAVARKIVQKDVLFGKDAVENRTMLDLYRPLERGLLKEGAEKDQQAIRELLSHLMEIAGVNEARANGATVRAVVGVPAEALRVNKQHVRDAMKGFVDGLMIVSEPFAVAYGLDALLHSIVVDVGAGTIGLAGTGTLTFQPGETVQTYTVNIIGDTDRALVVLFAGLGETGCARGTIQ